MIVAVYKRADFLELVLTSLEQQTYKNVEVIIAEDDQSETIRHLVHRRKENFPFTIKHVSQSDRGFRKNKILNKAVLASDGGLLIFIDGDCILHKEFIREHAKRLNPNQCLFGRRAMLSKTTTDRLLRSGNFHGLSPLSMLLGKTKHWEDGIYLPWLPSFRKSGVKGCNFSLPRELLLKINGFDEDFEKPYGGEDTDVERRLRLTNVDFKCSKFKTVQYHLYHGGREGREKTYKTEGKAFHQKKIKEARAYCRNGLFKSESMNRANHDGKSFS